MTVRTDDWTDPAWQAEADGWVTDRLARLGTPVTGEIERFRVRPWSVTHRVPTTAGPHWFKANITGCRYEAALAEALTTIAPGATLPPLAADPERGWLLTADAGPTLRETTMLTRDRTATWPRMLQAYAALQRATTPHVPELIAGGVPDQRVAHLPATLAALLADPQVRAGVDPAVPALVPEFGEWCAELAADGIPAALQHDDLHDDNVFADLRFFDWGDASAGHPFGSLLVALNVVHDALDPAERSRELPRLRDAYLEPWSDLAGAATLRRSVTLACRVTRVSRAAAWQRALRGAAVPVDEAFRSAPAAWLNELPSPDTL
ncbi:phosphotransferase [Actinoplanes sp. DH11]|uniref:phosphotransferase n=1 Tax=Actinoplanes sp. DH11 TaxID=2857011 RepID=UPI001E5DD6E9|nr:phosphotransferase [Actinoplanes sp. DH11]